MSPPHQPLLPGDVAAWEEEGRTFGAYLLGRQPTPGIVARYALAMHALQLPVDEGDGRRLAYIRRHPWSIGFVDAGLALLRPQSSVRTKLLVMSAILEATPELAGLFLPVRRSPAYVLYVGFVGLRAGIKGVIGTALVAWI